MAGLAVIGYSIPSPTIVCSGHRNTGCRRMALVMFEASEGHRGVGAAALMIQTQRVSAGKVHRHTRIDREWQRSPHAWHHKPVLPRRIEAREIGFIHLLIR